MQKSKRRFIFLFSERIDERDADADAYADAFADAIANAIAGAGALANPNTFADANVVALPDNDPNSRPRRFTCDVFSFTSQWFSMNHAACAIKCMFQLRRGGRCQNGLCYCR